MEGQMSSTALARWCPLCREGRPPPVSSNDEGSSSLLLNVNELLVHLFGAHSVLVADVERFGRADASPPAPSLAVSTSESVYAGLPLTSQHTSSSTSELVSLPAMAVEEYFRQWRGIFEAFCKKTGVSRRAGFANSVTANHAVLTEYCTTLHVQDKPFFLLGEPPSINDDDDDVASHGTTIRQSASSKKSMAGRSIKHDTAADSHRRQIARLNEVLAHQQLERTDIEMQRSYLTRPCLFCRKPVIDASEARPREAYFAHLTGTHSVDLGKLDSMVYVSDFLNMLDAKLTALQCIYCEGTFRSHVTLREHMRKKRHMRLNVESTEYDRFFISNYLTEGQTWRSRVNARRMMNQDRPSYPVINIGKRIDPREAETSRNDKWDDWIDENGDLVSCLFCSRQIITEQFEEHIHETHFFNPTAPLRIGDVEHSLSFHACIARINYICASIEALRCPYGDTCDVAQPFIDRAAVVKHAQEARHFNLPPPADSVLPAERLDPAVALNAWDWRHQRFLLPTAETADKYSEAFRLLLNMVETSEFDDESEDAGEKNLPTEHTRPRFMELADGTVVDVTTLL